MRKAKLTPEESKRRQYERVKKWKQQNKNHVLQYYNDYYYQVQKHKEIDAEHRNLLQRQRRLYNKTFKELANIQI
jgi:hypothetical protein